MAIQVRHHCRVNAVVDAGGREPEHILAKDFLQRKMYALAVFAGDQLAGFVELFCKRASNFNFQKTQKYYFRKNRLLHTKHFLLFNISIKKPVLCLLVSLQKFHKRENEKSYRT
jgi:hypothetical protein